MDEHTRKDGRLHEGRPGALGALIHEAVRRAIEVAVEEELTAALGAGRYARDVDRGGYRAEVAGALLRRGPEPPGGGDELLTFFQFPKSPWKTPRT